MTTSKLSDVILHLRRAVLLPDGVEPTDKQLLGNYLSCRDEVALAILVRRHGPLVWGVCCRLLHSYHDAEDAFQATFLVVVRKVAAIASPELLANAVDALDAGCRKGLGELISNCFHDRAPCLESYLPARQYKVHAKPRRIVCKDAALDSGARRRRGTRRPANGVSGMHATPKPVGPSEAFSLYLPPILLLFLSLLFTGALKNS
jgi:hypothetical protein